MEQRDRALVEAAQRGDERAWESLIRAWLPQVHGWCARLGGPRVDPHDAVQDVFVVLHTRLHALQDPERFASWTFTVTRRVLYRHRSRAWLRRWLPGPLPMIGDHRQRPDRACQRSELARQVQQVLERLPASQREVLVLCDVEGRTSLEAAQLTGIPHGTARSRLRLGRARFRREAESLTMLEELSDAAKGEAS